MSLPEPSETAKRLLQALLAIEDREIKVARENGCKCSAPVPGTDRNFPYATFDREKSVGKPFDQIVWRIQHEEGCPMDGQEGIG